MEKQLEIPIPNNLPQTVEHFCKDDLAAEQKAKAAGKIKLIHARVITMQPALDPRWLVGHCFRCKEIITREAKL